MGCGTSLPSDDEFLKPQSLSTDCLLGGIADASAGNIVIRFPPCGQGLAVRSGTYEMCDAAGAGLAKVTVTDQFKGISIVRDPAGVILAALQSTTTSQAGLSGMSTQKLITFGARPRFEGQPVGLTIENVGLYPWVLSTRQV